MAVSEDGSGSGQRPRFCWPAACRARLLRLTARTASASSAHAAGPLVTGGCGVRSHGSCPRRAKAAGGGCRPAGARSPATLSFVRLFPGATVLVCLVTVRRIRLPSGPNPRLTDAARRPLHGLCRSSSGSATHSLPRWSKKIESSPRPHDRHTSKSLAYVIGLLIGITRLE